MEAIREYLKNLFMNLPETPEVLRAKAELMEMMGDKYEELIREGKSEKEAVGIVISEFGNLEELAEELGIGSYMKQNEEESENPSKKKPVKKEFCWKFEDVKAYVEYAWRHAGFIALGVMLCIWTPFFCSILDGIVSAGYMAEVVAAVFQTLITFLFVSVAVGLFCGASGMKKPYGNAARYRISLDSQGQNYLQEKQEKDETVRLNMRIAGVALCIFSVVPSSLNYVNNIVISEILDNSVLFFAGIGVLLLVLSASVGNRHDELRKAVKQGGGMAAQDGSYPYAAPAQIRKKGMPAAIILLFVFAGFLVVGGSIAAALTWGQSYEGQQIQTVNEFDAGELERIFVDIDAGNVNLEMADIDKIKVEYSGDIKYKPDIEHRSSELCIQDGKRNGHWINVGFGIFRRSFERTTTIIIPKDQIELIYEIDVDAANIIMEGIKGRRTIVNVDAGNITGNDCAFLEESNVDVDAGNAEFFASSFKQLEVDVDMGNFTYQSVTPLDYYSVEIEVDLGDVNYRGSDVSGTYNSSPVKPQEGESYSIKANVDLGNAEIYE